MSSQEDTDTSDLTPSEDESSLSDSSDRESGMVSDDEELPAKRATVAVMEEDLSEFASIFVLDKDSSSRKRSEQKLSYESVSLEPEKEKTPEEKKSLSSSTSSACFNCGDTSHSMSACPLPKDQKTIAKNRELFVANKGLLTLNAERYYENKGNKYLAGELSTSLRDALGIGSTDPPPWYPKMLQYGYPPGYIRELNEVQDRLTLVIDGPVADAKNVASSVTPIVNFPGIDNSALVDVTLKMRKGAVIDVDAIEKVRKKKNSSANKKNLKKAPSTPKQPGEKEKKKKRVKPIVILEDGEIMETKGLGPRDDFGSMNNSQKRGKNNTNVIVIEDDPTSMVSTKKFDKSAKKKKSPKKISNDDATVVQPVLKRPVPQWSDASEGRYEASQSTGVWAKLTPILKKRKEDMK